ncbi:HAD-IA family hydrolase [Brachyspira catarrhinii]|uniref:HAD family phosphatase n=1 Tax=Brachyspira catarrhinii TaxID=2528966 RepID=A0ABY2TUV7_9SPIR|nr:HAD-IA family hydrolase [Brachyspira catarrhinii]TKZ36218.1 HAD family phosphatase [Brachyspira catarrhinii]
MIKNIISDIGNVLFEFDTTGFINKNIEAEDKEKFFDLVFGNENWQLMDKGDLAFEDARKYFLSVYPKYKDSLNKLFDSSLTLCLNMNNNNINILKEYKEKCYNIYYLSNMSVETFQCINKKTDFFETTCIGGIVSAYEKMIKPSEEIYKLLLNRFNLKAEECLFIDDNLNNVNSALKLGFNSFQLKNMSDMRFELEKILK